jgi:SAM-dependent methyltransferase
MIIPEEAIKYILFQRTEYLIYQNNRWLNSIVIRLPFLSYNRMVSFEAWLFKNRIKKLFLKDMEREYESVKNYLPEKPTAILDIGCGVAGIDARLSDHYKEKGKKVDFCLLDKTELNEKVYYGLEKRAAFYNSLEIARNLLIANGVMGQNIYTQEAIGAPIFPSKKFDLILSLVSWGFHYPVETYLDEVYEKLMPGGTLIIDIRKGTEGEKLLEKKFGVASQFITDEKKRRRAFIKKEV